MCIRQDRLYVANVWAPVITVFDLTGGYLGEMSGDLVSTRGIFPDGSGNIWTCDYNTHELIAFGPDGTIAERIDFNTLLDGRTQSRRPIYGAFDGRHAFIQVSDDTNRNGILVRLDLERPSQSLRLHPAEGMNTPGGIHCRNNSVYFANQRNPILYSIDTELSEPVRIYSQSIGWIINFDTIADDFFLSIPTELVRIDPQGNRLQTISYASILNIFNHYIEGVTAFESADGNFLFLADGRSNHIYKVAI